MPEQNSEPSRPFDPPLPPTTPPTAPPAPPEAPPAPPAPSAPDRPPVPQYGEYAPAGYLPSGDASAPPASNPYGVPGYGAQAAIPGYAPAGAAPRKKRRTWDVVLSSILLVLALFGTAADGPPGWEAERTFAVAYWLGRKHYDCRLARKRLPGVFADARDDLRRQLFPDLAP